MQPTAAPSYHELVVSVTRKGQITLPAEARRQLGTDKLRKVAFVIEPSGAIRLKAPIYPTFESLAGVVPPLNPPKTWQEIQAIIADDRAEAYRAKQ